MNAGIELDSITRIVDGEVHLADISLTLEPSSFNVVLGRTRAGKTSLLRVLAGLDRPTSGAIRKDGADVTRAGVRARGAAMVYQQFVNYPSLSVYENIASPLRAAGLDPSEIDRRVRDTAERLRLADLLPRLPAELSGGQQQRTAIARALVKRARLVLLDEPLANLDYKLREELREELRDLFQGGSAVVVYTTSDPAEALLFGGQLVVLDEGRLLQAGPAHEVYRAPASIRAALVLSDPPMNLFDAEVLPAGGARLAGAEFLRTGHLAGLPSGPVRLGVRPDHVRLERGEDADICLDATVEGEEQNGFETLIQASAGGASLLSVVEGTAPHARGARVELFIHPNHLFAFEPGGALLAAPTDSHGPH